MTAGVNQGLELWPEAMPAKQLFILLHGVGGQASDMLPLVGRFKHEFPQAGFFLAAGTFPYDGGGDGRQWYSNYKITDESRALRIAEQISTLHELVRYAQQKFNVLQTDTALVGFSQGASMALQYCIQHDGQVGRALVIAGRLTVTPDKAPELTTIHLLHGDTDKVVTASHAQLAFECLQQIEGDVTLDVLPATAHEINLAVTECAIHRLKTTIPKRSWLLAMKSA